MRLSGGDSDCRSAKPADKAHQSHCVVVFITRKINVIRALGGPRVSFNLASTAANMTKMLSCAVALFAPTDRATAEQTLAAAVAKLTAGRSLASTLRAQKTVWHRLS